MGQRRTYILLGFTLVNLLVFCTWLYSPYTLTGLSSKLPNDFSGVMKPSLPAALLNQRENATFVTLCRNDDLGAISSTIISYEDRFNQNFGYDWVFLNNEEFSEEFISVISNLVSGEAKFGVIPHDQWSIPPWVDEERARAAMKDLEDKGIIYGGSESYRHMCRFESGFFYNHELMKPYKYYWRVEPDTKCFCDLKFDVFRYMRENGYRYGFTLALYEFMETIPTLWESTLKWVQSYPEYVQPDNLGRFITEDQGRTYNGCHFWTNLEIADADFWRDEAYTSYFEYLDRLGGFFYERWGDAPVHSVAASIMMKREEIVHLDFIGYNHPPFQHVPADFIERDIRCAANPGDNLDWDMFSCLRHFYTAQDQTDNIPAGVSRVLY